MANVFGKAFCVMTFGESHGRGLGCVIDGCPPQIPLTTEHIQNFLNRRKPGQSPYASPRKESDLCEILSGVEEGITLGTPIAIFVPNIDKKAEDYDELKHIFRPGHADYTTLAKYGVTSRSGGGRASARETVGRVAAAAVAQACVQHFIPGTSVLAWVARIADIEATVCENSVSHEDIEASVLRCPDSTADALMQQKLQQAKSAGDSLGGLIRCQIRGLPAGLGAPVFDKLEADLAKAMLSLPASKSFEAGNGLAATFLTGSQNNDAYGLNEEHRVYTTSNRSGGIQGGITNGMPISFAVGFKPVSTIYTPQKTLNRSFAEIDFKLKSGRHDPCVLPRAVPLVEAMAWLVVADHLLRQFAIRPFLGNQEPRKSGRPEENQKAQKTQA